MADAVVNKERFAQAVRANLPVNPVSGAEFVGQNMTRLLNARRSAGWRDPRFISEADAARMGWEIDMAAISVPMQVRADGGKLQEVKLFNAQFVKGMPTVEDMLGMSENEFATMQGREQYELEGEVRIGPARRQQALVEEHMQPVMPEPEKEAKAGVLSGRYVVMVPYWLDKMHNAEGIAIASELNALVRESGLEFNPGAIQRLLEGRDRAWMFEPRVVPEEELANDPHWRADAARPHSLLGGALVRDAQGAYRPRAGGLPVIEDKGDSLVAKSKSFEAIKASVELAVAKGWKSIELSGDPRKLGDCWLEAKLAGLEVVNYSPTLEDEKRLAERMPKEVAAPVVEKVVEQTPEIVEMRPYIDADGQQRTATIVYTVTQEGVPDQQVGTAKEAAALFARAPVNALPAVVRTVMRADGQVDAEVMVAGTGRGRGTTALQKSADPAIDEEFSQALGEVIAADKVHQGVEKADTPAQQMFSGLILRIEGNEVVQKVGRDPSQIVRHDISKLTAVPTVGEVVDITFGKNGRGVVAQKQAEKEVER